MMMLDLLGECIHAMQAGRNDVILYLGPRKGKDLGDRVRLTRTVGPIGTVVSATEGVIVARFEAQKLLEWCAKTCYR